MPSASVAKFQRSIAPKGDLWACARASYVDVRQWSTIKGIPLALTSAWFIDAGAALSRIASVVVRTVVIKIWFAVFVSIVTSIEWNCTCISFVLKSVINKKREKNKMLWIFLRLFRIRKITCESFQRTWQKRIMRKIVKIIFDFMRKAEILTVQDSKAF